ncbi:hypothetical protein P9112_004170 [Eukaryota sp. TZLM1-RC]
MQLTTLFFVLLVVASVQAEGKCKQESDTHIKCSIQLRETIREIYHLKADIDVLFMFDTESGSGSVRTFIDGADQPIVEHDIDVITSRHFCFFHRGASYCVTFEDGDVTSECVTVDVSLEVHFVVDLGYYEMGEIRLGNCSDDDATRAQFDAWLNDQNKVYSSKQEYEYRLSVFADNLQRIAFQNSVQPDAEFGVNQFADMTEAEFAEFLGPAFEPKKGALKSVKCNAEVPESFDWTQKDGVVGKIKNQGSCGSCWAFSANAASESAYFLKHGKTAIFSEQHLVDCDPQSSGCNGGLMHYAYEYLNEFGGHIAEEDYPYVARNQRCSASKEKIVEGANVVEYYEIAEGDGFDHTKSCLVEHGVLAIAMNANSLQFYLKGIFNPLMCSPSKLSHAVNLVGYGSEKGKDFVKVRNSWGERWGEHGYFRMAIGKATSGTCGWNTYVVVPKLQ